MSDAIPTSDQIASAPETPRRRRISRALIVGLVLSVVLLAGAGLLARQAATDAHRATVDRDAATAELGDQTARTAAADDQLASAQKDAAAFADAVTGPMGSAEHASQLTDQDLIQEQRVQAAGIAIDDHTYNSAIDQSNALIAQINSTLDQLVTQVDQLPKP